MIGPHRPRAGRSWRSSTRRSCRCKRRCSSTPSTQNRRRALAVAGAGGALRLERHACRAGAVVACRAVAAAGAGRLARRRAARVCVARVRGDRATHARCRRRCGPACTSSRDTIRRRTSCRSATCGRRRRRRKCRRCRRWRRVLRAFAVRIGARGDRVAGAVGGARLRVRAGVARAAAGALAAHAVDAEVGRALGAAAHVVPCVFSGRHAVPAQ